MNKSPELIAKIKVIGARLLKRPLTDKEALDLIELIENNQVNFSQRQATQYLRQFTVDHGGMITKAMTESDNTDRVAQDLLNELMKGR
jgi:hypothetical protein